MKRFELPLPANPEEAHAASPHVTDPDERKSIEAIIVEDFFADLQR